MVEPEEGNDEGGVCPGSAVAHISTRGTLGRPLWLSGAWHCSAAMFGAGWCEFGPDTIIEPVGSATTWLIIDILEWDYMEFPM